MLSLAFEVDLSDFMVSPHLIVSLCTTDYTPYIFVYGGGGLGDGAIEFIRDPTP